MLTTATPYQNKLMDDDSYWATDVKDLMSLLSKTSDTKSDLEEKYNKLVNDYKRLSGEYNQVLKEHLELLNKYRLLTDKFTELVEKQNVELANKNNKITIN